MRRSWLRLFLSGLALLGLVVAWLVWSGYATRRLHRELEDQLSSRLGRAVSLEAVAVELDRGLRVAVRNLRIHPTPARDREPMLRAGRVIAWLDLPALLVGRISLSSVTLEGPSLRLERAADGSFPDLGLGPGAPAPPAADAAYGEALVRAIEQLEPLADRAATRLLIVSSLEIHDGTVALVDQSRPADEPPLRLELLEIEAHRDWLSEASSLAIGAVVVDGHHAPFPVHFDVRREEDRPFVWDLRWEGVSLAAARRLVPSLPLLTGLKGRWSAKLHAERTAAGGTVLSLESKVAKAKLVLPQSQRTMALDALSLRARVELERGQVRLRDAHLEGGRIQSDFEVRVDRPLRPASTAKLETRLLGVEFGDLRALVDSLADEFETARSMSRLVERVESGRILHIEGSGSAPLLRWQSLWRGGERELPEDFLLAGAFDRVNLAQGASGEVRDLAGEVEWLGDRLVLRNTRARYRERWLPAMDLTLDGVSHFVRATRKAPRVSHGPPPLAGVAPLMKILRPRDPNALPPVKAIGLAIDHLDHPLLRWPLRDARVLVEPVRHGVQINVREGVLAGAKVAGEIVYASEPGDGKLTATLQFARGPAKKSAPTQASASSASPTQAAPSPKPASRWASGEIEIEFRPRPRLPFARATGFFRLEGTDFLARDVEIALAPQGTVETRGVVGLEAADSVGLELSFALTDGRYESHGEFFALPANLITGGMQVTGRLAGRVRPDQSFVAELEGRFEAAATSGRVALGVPLLLRLAKATEGYNPFANAHEIEYETMRATIDLDHGRLDSQDFALEGPLRVYANAAIDTNPRPVDIRAVVGIFLFRAPSEILSNLPIVSALLPGSERGLIGAYFRVRGAIGEPKIDALPFETFLSAVPSAIRAPMKVLQYLFDRGEREEMPGPRRRERRDEGAR